VPLVAVTASGKKVAPAAGVIVGTCSATYVAVVTLVLAPRESQLTTAGRVTSRSSSRE
jgi:hypothetical protein